MKKLGILTVFALLTTVPLSSEPVPQQLAEMHLEALNALLPSGFSLKQEKVEVSNRGAHSEARLVNPTIYYFGSFPVARQEGDLIILTDGKKYTFSTTGTTHILASGAQLDITSPIKATVQRSGDALLLPSNSFDDLFQTWEQFEFQLGKGQIISSEQQQKATIADIGLIGGKLIHVGEAGKSSRYRFESTADTVSFPGLTSERCRGISSLMQQFRNSKGFDPALDQVLKLFSTNSPSEYGVIHFSFSGSIIIPQKDELLKIVNIACKKPGEAVRLAAESNPSIDFSSWQYSDRFSTSSGSTSLRATIVNHAPRLAIENRSQVKFSKDYTENIKKAIVNACLDFPIKKFAEQFQEKEIDAVLPNFHQVGNITSALSIALDFQQELVEKTSFQINFSLDKPDIGGNLSGYIEGMAKKDPNQWRGKASLKLSNYEEMIRGGIAFYNRLANLFKKIDQSGCYWVPLHPDQAEIIGKEGLLYFSTDPTSSEKNIQIDVDYTDPATAKIGQIPLRSLGLGL